MTFRTGVLFVVTIYLTGCFQNFPFRAPGEPSVPGTLHFCQNFQVTAPQEEGWIFYADAQYHGRGYKAFRQTSGYHLSDGVRRFFSLEREIAFGKTFINGSYGEIICRGTHVFPTLDNQQDFIPLMHARPLGNFDPQMQVSSVTKASVLPGATCLRIQGSTAQSRLVLFRCLGPDSLWSGFDIQFLEENSTRDVIFSEDRIRMFFRGIEVR